MQEKHEAIEHELFGPWMQVTKRRNRSKAVEGSFSVPPANQRKQTPTNQRFAVLNKKESAKSLQNQAEFLPKPV